MGGICDGRTRSHPRLVARLGQVRLRGRADAGQSGERRDGEASQQLRRGCPRQGSFHLCAAAAGAGTSPVKVRGPQWLCLNPLPHEGFLYKQCTPGSYVFLIGHCLLTGKFSLLMFIVMTVSFCELIYPDAPVLPPAHPAFPRGEEPPVPAPPLCAPLLVHSWLWSAALLGVRPCAELGRLHLPLKR